MAWLTSTGVTLMVNAVVHEGIMKNRDIINILEVGN